VHQLIFSLFSNYPESIENFKTRKIETKNNAVKKYALRETKKENFSAFFTAYLLILLLLYIFPFKGFIDLNKVDIFSFRGDHVVHLFVFIPIPFLVAKVFRSNKNRKWIKIVFISLLIGVFFELIHVVIPYRAFTVADLLANLVGIGLGVIFVLIRRKKYKY
jgi:glycopeptide antibiotics resistance protein